LNKYGLYFTKRQSVVGYSYNVLKIPDDFKYEADIVESGNYHICMSKVGKVGCFGENYYDEIIVPDEIKELNV
jgi:hypothetical protein